MKQMLDEYKIFNYDFMDDWHGRNKSYNKIETRPMKGHPPKGKTVIAHTLLSCVLGEH